MPTQGNQSPLGATQSPEDCADNCATLPRSPISEGKICPELANKFRASAWCDGSRTFTQHDVALAMELLAALAAPTSSNAGLYIHLQTTARCARMLAEKYNESCSSTTSKIPLNVDLVEAVALIHDAGRFATHAWYINDLFLHHMLNFLNVDHTYRSAVLWPEDAFSPGHNLSDLQKIVIIADMISKVDMNSSAMKTPAEAVEYHEQSRGKMSLRPITKYKIEQRNIKRYSDPTAVDIHNQWADVYRKLFDWAEGELGVNVGEIQTRALRGCKTIYNTESRPVVVFDLGGVAFKLADRELFRNVALMLFKSSDENLEEDTNFVEKAATGSSILAKVQSGESTEIDWSTEILQALRNNHTSASRLKIEGSDDTATLMEMAKAFGDLKIERFEPVFELVKKLKDHGYRVVALSDTIPGHIPHLRATFSEFDRIFCSPEIGVSKKRPDTGHFAFWTVAATLGIMPQQMVFIDDRNDCLAAASRVGATTFQWQENPSEETMNTLIKDLEATIARHPQHS